jgi:hypothetical protein
LGTAGTISENGFSRSPFPLLLITAVRRDLMALHRERRCRDLQLTGGGNKETPLPIWL